MSEPALRREATPGYVVGAFPSDTELFVLRELEAWRRHGTRPHIFSLRPSGPGLHDDARGWQDHTWTAAPSLLQGLTSPSPWLAHVARRARRTPLDALKTLRHLASARQLAALCARNGIRHLHAHFAYLPADVAMRAAALARIPFSVSAHAWDIYAGPAWIEPVLRRAAFVTVCTRRGHEALGRRFPSLDPARLIMLPDGIDSSQFEPAARPGTEVLAVGRLQEKKGLRDLIRALSILRPAFPELRGTIVGSGPLLGHLTACIRDAGLGDIVRITPPVSQEALREHYRRAAMLVQPSIVADNGDRDGLPNVLLEAQAMGLPVVSTRAGAAEELITDGTNGLLVGPGAPEELAAAMRRLLEHADDARAMGRAGRRIVNTRFDLATVTAPLIDRIEQSMRRHGID